MDKVTFQIEGVTLTFFPDGEVFPKDWAAPIVIDAVDLDDARDKARAYILANPTQF